MKEDTLGANDIAVHGKNDTEEEQTGRYPCMRAASCRQVTCIRTEEACSGFRCDPKYRIKQLEDIALSLLAARSDLDKAVKSTGQLHGSPAFYSPARIKDGIAQYRQRETEAAAPKSDPEREESNLTQVTLSAQCVEKLLLDHFFGQESKGHGIKFNWNGSTAFFPHAMHGLEIVRERAGSFDAVAAARGIPAGSWKDLAVTKIQLTADQLLRLLAERLFGHMKEKGDVHLSWKFRGNERGGDIFDSMVAVHARERASEAPGWHGTGVGR